MLICRSIGELRDACRQSRTAGGTLALVPTMGALHEGHRSLVHAARESADVTVVSIFVNPTQFGAAEDFSSYPRTWDADLGLLERENVDIVFAPQAEEIYPAGSETFVDVGSIGARLDGASRPGHFRGVATVVAKLFHMVGPDLAFFGQKDAAQVAVIQAVVRDLNLPAEVKICPIVRDADGLALSSRNRYLDAKQRENALALYRSLRVVQDALNRGNTSPVKLREQWRTYLQNSPGIRLDYAELVDPDTLLPVQNLQQRTLAAVAAWVGTTRLIDNALLGTAQPGTI